MGRERRSTVRGKGHRDLVAAPRGVSLRARPWVLAAVLGLHCLWDGTEGWSLGDGRGGRVGRRNRGVIQTDGMIDSRQV